MATSYLTLEQFRKRSVMPDTDVDRLEAKRPGFVLLRLERHTSWINARLFKRYAVPFVNPTELVLGWLTDLVTLDCYMARGFNPASEQDQLVEKAATTASTEVLEAASAEKGHFDLPLREDTSAASAVSRGGPLGESQASPYDWLDEQAEAVRG